MIRSNLQNLSSYKSPKRRGTVGVTGKATAFTGGSNPGVAYKPPYPVAGAPAPAPGGAQSPLVANEQMPWDAQYEKVVGGINTSLGSTLAGLTDDENALGADFGVKFDRGPDGTLNNFTLDPSNPFSRAALLQRAYQQRQKSTTGQLAGQGQLYSGYHQSKQDEATFDNQQAGDQLLKGFGGMARQIMQRRQEAQGAAAGGINDAGWDRLNALNNAPPPPAPDARAKLTQAAGGNLGDLKLTAQGLMRRNPFTGKYDIPVTL